MLMRICKCGRRMAQGEKCPCQKERHSIYEEKRRDKVKREFYSSAEWRKTAAAVKARAKGLDEYLLAVEGRIELGTTVHHIYPIEERPDLKINFDNLIFVSSRTHNKIHAEYNLGEKERRQLQAKLIEVRQGTKRGDSNGGTSEKSRRNFDRENQQERKT